MGSSPSWETLEWRETLAPDTPAGLSTRSEVPGKSSRKKVGTGGIRAGLKREMNAALTPASAITRAAKSGVEESSRATTTAPQSRQPQNAATHSAEFGAHSNTRSPVRTPFSFNRMARHAAAPASF